MHLPAAQLGFSPSKCNLRSRIHQSYSTILIERVDAFTHAGGDRFIEIKLNTQLFFGPLTFTDVCVHAAQANRLAFSVGDDGQVRLDPDDAPIPGDPAEFSRAIT